jgi:hypothetical protein
MDAVEWEMQVQFLEVFGLKYMDRIALFSNQTDSNSSTTIAEPVIRIVVLMILYCPSCMYFSHKLNFPPCTVGFNPWLNCRHMIVELPL